MTLAEDHDLIEALAPEAPAQAPSFASSATTRGEPHAGFVVYLRGAGAGACPGGNACMPPAGRSPARLAPR